MVVDILTKPLSAEPFERYVGNITDMNNYNANCAEGFWTVEAGEEYHSSDEEEGDDILRKISSPYLKSNQRYIFAPDSASSGSVDLINKYHIGVQHLC